jgi:hypothetical protein
VAAIGLAAGTVSFVPCPIGQTICFVSQGPGTCNALYSDIPVLS